jgi:hypothetical protein
MVGTRPFLDAVPKYEVREGVMHITADGFELAMPLRKFEQGMLRAEEAIAKYRAERGAVLSMRKGARRKG